MKNNNNSKTSFWRTVLLIIVIVFVINFVTSESIFKKIISVFSDDSHYSVYIHDEANILSDDTKKYITNKNASLEASTGSQVIIVTVYSLNGSDIAEMTYSRFTQYAPGDSSKNNGILLFFAVQDNAYYALQGRGIEDSLSSGTLRLMLDTNVKPAFEKGNCDSGIKNMFDAVTSHLEKMYSVTLSADHSPAHYMKGSGLFDKLGKLLSELTGIAAKLIKTAVILIFSLTGVIAAIVVIALSAKDKKRKDGTEPPPPQKKENKNPYSNK